MSLMLFALMIFWPAEGTMVEESYVKTVGTATASVDGLAEYKSEQAHWLIGISKTGHSLMIIDATTGEKIQDLGSQGTGPLQFSSPQDVLVLDDYALIVERGNRRIQVLKLPELSFVTYVGRTVLKRPTGMDAYRTGDGEYRLFVTDAYDVPAPLAAQLMSAVPDGEAAAEDVATEATPEPTSAVESEATTDGDGESKYADFFGKRIKQFSLTLKGFTVKVNYSKAFGANGGAGLLYKPEGILADPVNNRLYIRDMDGPSKGIKIYNLDGFYSDQTVVTESFTGEAGDMALLVTGTSTGFVICSDVTEAGTVFHVMERNSLRLLGSFNGSTAVASNALTVGNESLWALYGRQLLAAFEWRKVEAGLGL